MQERNNDQGERFAWAFDNLNEIYSQTKSKRTKEAMLWRVKGWLVNKEHELKDYFEED